MVHTPLINPEIVYLPPLHIQLGLIKNVVKTMDQNSAGFMYLKNKFPRIHDAKIKEGIFVWPQITELIQEIKFEGQLYEAEKAPWKSLKKSLPIFLGNHTADNYHDIAAGLVQSQFQFKFVSSF